MPFFARVLAVLCLASLMTACTTTGEVLLGNPASLAGTGKAKITTDSEHDHTILAGLDRRIYITSLDGKSLFRLGATSDYPEGMLLDPGRHEISIRFLHFNTFANGRLWFVAEREKSYIVRKQMENYSVRLWIEDMLTGRPVGGIVP